MRIDSERLWILVKPSRVVDPGFYLILFSSCEVLLVLSCLGQAADVLASTTRSSATGSTSKAPLKLEQVPQWGSA